VWWPALDPLCRPDEGLVDVIEAEPEAFWTPAPGKVGFSSSLVGALVHLPQPKLLHGVGSPLGGTSSPPSGHMETLARDVAALCPEFVSEHLSFTRFRPNPDGQPIFAGFLLPPLQSEAGVALAAENIRRRRTALNDIPLAVETTVSYLPPAPGEWEDGAFVKATVEAADCGILLDLHNVWCNALNGRQSVETFLDTIPKERVWELHLAGGEIESGFRVDAHSGLVEPELMEIAANLVPGLPQLRAIIFEIMPERVAEVGLAAVGQQLVQIKGSWNTPPVSPRSDKQAHWAELPKEPELDSESWEVLLGCAVSGLPLPAISQEISEWLRSSTPAVDLYRRLLAEGRANAVAAAAPRTVKLLLRQCGGPGTRAILAEFWTQSPREYMGADEARAFFRFLSEGQPARPGLMEAVAADLAEMAEL
jgi:uncharacterized protein